MNLSLSKLRERIPSLPADAEAVVSLLSERKIEVARIVPLAELLRPIVVGRVETVSQHQNADRLRICIVSDGSERMLQIITGAPNVREGGLYPLIRSGISLPNGTKIKRGKLRGEISEGMLGSADELELGSDHDGLLELAGDLAPGTPLPDVIAVGDDTMLVLTGDATFEEVIEALSAPVDATPSAS